MWDAVWAPWGNVYSITGTTTLDARLPGQWFQLESGLHYNWHRHYDPTLGRYTQRWFRLFGQVFRSDKWIICRV